MSQPSEEAYKAAEEYLYWNSDSIVPEYIIYARQHLASIIDQETNLPALKAACEACLEEFNDRYDGAPDAGYKWMGALIHQLESALGKR